jgi:RNA-directed DNA polymerase
MQHAAIETEGQLAWNAIDWRTMHRRVRNLRQRIFKAERKGERRKVRSLQQLMLRSYSNTLQSVRRVTQQNHGKHTPGVDNVVVTTAPARIRLVTHLHHTQSWRASKVKRVFIPKQNGKLRPLGIATIADRAMQARVKNALEPQWEARFEPRSYGFRPGRSAHDASDYVTGPSCAAGQSGHGSWTQNGCQGCRVDCRSAAPRVAAGQLHSCP